MSFCFLYNVVSENYSVQNSPWGGGGSIASSRSIQWLEHLWYNENMLETGISRANECLSKRQVRRHNRDIFFIFFNMKVCCVFSLESPPRGDSNEYPQYTIFNIKKKITLNYSKSVAMFSFQETQERVRNSRG